MLGAEGYFGGVRSGGTFGIDAFAYAQHLKRLLVARGVRVFEGSRVTSVGRGHVATADATVSARTIVLCLDRFAADFGIASRHVYRARAFLALTEPLDASTIGRMFPAGPLLVWDTDLLYHYFRPTAEGRLLVGGGTLRKTFAKRAGLDTAAFDGIERYAKERFPVLRGARFTHAWRGLIGLSRDILPLAGPSPTDPRCFYALCAAGLPWSVMAGNCAATRALGGVTPLDRFFAPNRRFPFETLQALLPRSVAWAWFYYYAKNIQRH